MTEGSAAYARHAKAGTRLSDARVRALIAARRRQYVALSTVISAVYVAVAAGFAFTPSLMARPVIGASISVGIVSIAIVMLAGIAFAGYYTWWANTVHARLLEDTARAGTLRDR